jgi:cytochrome P450
MGTYLQMRSAPGPSWFELLKESFSEEPRDEHYWCLEYPLKLTARYGEVIYISPRKQFVLTGAQGFEHVLKTNHHQYQRDLNFYGKSLFPLFGNSLLVTEGQPWKNRRKSARPFYQKSRLQEYVPVFSTSAHQFIESWKKKTPKPIDILSAMNHLTLNIAAELMCSLQFNKCILKKIESEISFFNWYCSHAPFQFGLTLMLKKLRFAYNRRCIDQRLLKIIQHRRDNPQDSSDLLNRLLKTHSFSENGFAQEDNATLNNTEVLAELKTHLITGHETTACSLAWLWFLMAKHSEYQEQLIAEVDSVLNGNPVTWEDIPKLVITRAIVLETLRLYPPIWSIVRNNKEADTLLGLQIPKNSSLLLNIHSLHHNPHYWSNAKKFHPERFLKPDPNRHPFAYLPFGSAAHQCIAYQLAPLEMIVLVATIAQQFRFEGLKKSLKDPMRARPWISLKPHNGLRLIPRPR